MQNSYWCVIEASKIYKNLETTDVLVWLILDHFGSSVFGRLLFKLAIDLHCYSTLQDLCSEIVQNKYAQSKITRKRAYITYIDSVWYLKRILPESGYFARFHFLLVSTVRWLWLGKVDEGVPCCPIEDPVPQHHRIGHQAP